MTTKDNSLAKQLQGKIIAELALKTGQELDTLAETGHTVLIDNAIWKSDLTLPELPGGWKAEYVGDMEDGGRGRVILLPNHPQARSRWLRGQTLVGEKAGLSHEQAVIWANSKIPHKHDVLETLAAAMKDPSLADKYLTYNPRFTVAEYHQWSTRTGIRDRLTPKMRKTLMRLITEQRNPPTEEDRRNARRGKAGAPAEEERLPSSPALAALTSLPVAEPTEEVEQAPLKMRKPPKPAKPLIVVNSGNDQVVVDEKDLPQSDAADPVPYQEPAGDDSSTAADAAGE